jgi:hypothetical protein
MSKSRKVNTVRTRVVEWSFVALWALQPLLAGPGFAEALDTRSETFRTSVGGGLWVLWAAVLVAALIPRTTTLTFVRIVQPAAVTAAMWAAIATSSPGWPDVAALASTTAAAVLAFTPAVGEHFVNGSAYGAERRFPLRPPGVVMLGLVEAVWAVVAAGALAGPLLLAAGQWVLGGVLVAVGWPLALMGTRSLHRLAQRWLVFVPAGMALVDPLTLADSISMPRGITASIGPAPADTEAYDLSGGALGLALEVRFEEPRVVVPLAGGPDGSREVTADAVVFTPTRPGRVLREVQARRLTIS